MNKMVKGAAIAAGALAVLLVVLFVVIPLASAKTAQARLGEALAGAGVPSELWSAKRVRYVPVFGQVVVTDFALGGFVTVDKITLTIKTNRNDIFGGSVAVRGFSLATDGMAIVAKSAAVTDFAVDTGRLGGNPLDALTKLGTVSAAGVSFKQNRLTYFSLGKLNARVGYTEGNAPLPASITLKQLGVDVRQFKSIAGLRPEYRIATLAFKNAVSKGAYAITLTVDADKLFTLKTGFTVALPAEYDGIADFAALDYGEDIMLDSISLTYTDKSFVDHVFELAGLPGNRANAAEMLHDSIVELAELGGIDAERFAKEAAGFLQKPGKLVVKTNLASPVSFDDIGDDPFALKLSLSINGGKPFITSGY